MTQKDTESQDGSWIDKEISSKERISKLPPMFSKLSSERISKDCSRSEATVVSDTSGEWESEDNIPKLLEEEEKLSVSKERKNDSVIKINSILNQAFYRNF
jgi:hypothetical protein